MLKQNCVSFQKLNKQEKDSIFSFQTNFFSIFSFFQLAYLLHFLHAIKKISISRRVPPFSKNRGNDSEDETTSPRSCSTPFLSRFYSQTFPLSHPWKTQYFHKTRGPGIDVSASTIFRMHGYEEGTTLFLPDVIGF